MVLQHSPLIKRIDLVDIDGVGGASLKRRTVSLCRGAKFAANAAASMRPRHSQQINQIERLLCSDPISA
jgi:hypothetical protein